MLLPPRLHDVSTSSLPLPHQHIMDGPSIRLMQQHVLNRISSFFWRNPSYSQFISSYTYFYTYFTSREAFSRLEVLGRALHPI